MLAEQEKAVADQEQAHDDRAMNIHRSGWGWVTGVSLDARRDQRIEERRSLEIAVGELRFSHHIPGAGWVTAKALDEQIESLEEEIQETRDRAASSDYTIPGSQGWLNAQQAADLLAQPDCRPDGPRPCLDPKRRPLLHDYTHRFSPTLAVHIRLIEQEINKREAWRAQIGDHIAPRVKQIDNEVEQIGAMDNEFDQELHSARTRIQRRIDWLRDVRASQIP